MSFDAIYPTRQPPFQTANARTTANQAAAPDYPAGVRAKLHRRPARWNVVSLCIPFVGVLCGPLLGMFVFDILQGGQSYHPMALVAPAFIGWLTFCAIGLVATSIALVRVERLWALTAFGFFLNAFPIAAWAVSVISEIFRDLEMMEAYQSPASRQRYVLLSCRMG